MHQRIKYDVLSQKELEYMKGRLEQILIERGVHLDHEEMLKALEEKGCIVDMEARDVRFTKELIDKAIAEAVEDAKKDGIHGKAATPYLLAKIKDLTGGDSLDSNIQLVFNNARLGAAAAVELAKLER